MNVLQSLCNILLKNTYPFVIDENIDDELQPIEDDEMGSLDAGQPEGAQFEFDQEVKMSFGTFGPH